VNDLQKQANSVEKKEDEIKGKLKYPQNLKRIFWDFIILIIIAGSIVFLDYWTKNLIRQSLDLGESWMPLEWLAPFARIVHWRNSGAAFGMFQNGGLIFTILAIIVSIFIIFYFPQVPRKEWALRLAMGMQLGGALGNLLDRLLFDGYVTDFISVGAFPVFNIADSSIFIGVCVLLLGVWISGKKEKRENEELQLSE
jgi:signal peptidase II